MLFTRTIRRKMLAGLVLVLVMLITLSLSGLSGLSSYSSVVNDLDMSINQAPHPSDLTAAIVLLFDPLREQPKNFAQLNREQQEEFCRRQFEEFEKQRLQTVRQIEDFHRRLDQMPPTQTVLTNQPLTEAILSSLSQGLKKLEERQKLLADPARRENIAASMENEIHELLSRAQQVPDYQDGLNDSLLQARRAYRAHRLMIFWTTALAVALFAGLGWYGYAGIFSPLNMLHQGARRVALGNFNYRLELKTRDEMAELAEAFNLMTTRFQEIKNDLDRQVRERCKQLVRSERLAGIGFLAAGVAHEINNPLSAITMASDSLLSRLPETPVDEESDSEAITRQYLEMIQRQAAHCRQITAKLLDFARGQESTRCRSDLTVIVSEVLSMVKHMSKFRDRNIEFPRTEPCYLVVNPSEIKQVVLNLIANALESMAESGTMHVSLSEQTDQVILTFRDEGCGMTPEVIENLFDPFYTYGKNGQGTGLGLAISQRIIGDHGGTLEAFSDGPGTGSTFYVHLPREAHAPPSAAA